MTIEIRIYVISCAIVILRAHVSEIFTRLLTVLGYIHLAKFAKTCGIYISFSAPQLHWDELLLNELGSILLL